MKSIPELTSSLTTVRDYIRFAATQFNKANLCFGHGSASALDEAAAIVLHSLYMPYNLSDNYLNAALTLPERHAIVKLIERRIYERIPAAYLTHEAIFAGLPFYVDERVLIPRSPIAELIEQRFSPWVEEENVTRILDLCTGSGCIAIACAYAFPEALIDAVDLSADALVVAEVNLKKHHLSDGISMYLSDLFKQLPDVRYDLIVSNPPYVSLDEWQQLPQEFHAEPELGLKAGITGLDIVLKILAEAGDYLTENGVLIVEVGSSAQTLQDAFPKVPFVWLEFERGGDGVFLLTAQQVHHYHNLFISALI